MQKLKNKILKFFQDLNYYLFKRKILIIFFLDFFIDKLL